MDTPPPLPALKRPIQFATFHGKQQGAIRMVTATLHAEILHSAQQKAVDWINSHSDIEIVTIESCSNSIFAAVTVWYR